MTVAAFLPVVAGVLAIILSLTALKRIAAARMAEADMASRSDEGAVIRGEWIKIAAAWIVPVALYFVLRMPAFSDTASLTIF
ncbi:MAG: hypothetical protein U0S50_18315 [Sphingopyxis sp.]|uniref:hypothetical protein n=1 Tax=Sphingopyxis sp. TaxID=1908224 RepID=UPI002ABA6119|nr:hypothetical protein [Sphingopyxis sp.]MDZ3833745.1 hypothetical protein [Sphingopyxis sp.]